MRHPRQTLTAVILATVGLALASSASAQTPGTRNVIVARPGSQKWALLIGVERYINVNSLSYCGRDVADLRQRLVALGFPDNHVFVLHDGAEQRKYEPYRTNIEATMEMLLGTLDASGTRLAKPGLVGEGDMVVAAFSGHGIHVDGKSYFCPTDARLERTDSLVSLEHFYQLLSLSPARIKLLFVDACRNDPRPGGTKEMKATGETTSFAKSLTEPPKGTLVLSSCAPGQVSVEEESLKHGVFMHYVLQGLSGEADRTEGNRDGRVSLLELYRYAHLRTKEHVANSRRIPQTPELYGRIVGDFEFGEARPQPDPGTVIENSIGMKLAFIPPGEFLMGSPETEAERDDNESQHRVRITKGFYLGAYEVTQGEYERVMGTNPSDFSRTGSSKEGVSGMDTSRFPVENVSWARAVEFCGKLSQSAEEKRAGRKYRLPTEAEWEYACRAGATSPFSFGSELNGRDANCHGNYPYGTDVKGPYLKRTTAVGAYRPNAWGLYDMHGNVREWCQDCYEAGYYKSSPVDDPPGPSPGSSRVSRGGSWIFGAIYCRSANRHADDPTYHYSHVGFRVFCE